MTEEIVEEEIEIVEEPQEEPQEDVQEASEEEVIEEIPEEKPFDPKKDKVEFSTPEQEARFNEVFRQMKKSDTRNEMLTNFLSEQKQIIEDLEKQVGEITGNIRKTNETEAEKALHDRIQRAREEENFEEYDKAFAELTNFRVSGQVSKLVDEKVNGLLKQEQATEKKQAEFVARAMEERDESGGYVRPWLQENDPNFGLAIYNIQTIAKKYENDPLVFEKTLQELDQRMAEISGGGQMKKPPAKTNTRVPNPMQGSNLTNQKPRGKIKMTAKEKQILDNLNRHRPAGKKIDPQKWASRRDAMGGQNG